MGNNLKIYQTKAAYEADKDNLTPPYVALLKYKGKVTTFKRNMFVATFNVTNISSATRILGSAFDISQVEEMFIDDMEVAISATYQFSNTGLHKAMVYLKEGFTSCYAMFHNCIYLNVVDFADFDTSNVTNMTGMFETWQ